MEQSLVHLNPQRVLERGYALVQQASGAIVRDSAALQPGEAVELTFAHGAADARITATRPG